MSTAKVVTILHPSSAVNNIVNDASGNVAVGGTLSVGGVANALGVPSTSGNVLTSNGTAWVSSAPAASSTSISNGTSNVTIASSNGSITMTTAGTSAATIDTSQNWKFNSGYGSVATAYGCRAWVNFNGTSGTIRASGNVSSITSNGTGDYTVNFTTAMPDANYSCVATPSSSGSDSSLANIRSAATAPTTSLVRIGCVNGSGTFLNPTYVNVSIFR